MLDVCKVLLKYKPLIDEISNRTKHDHLEHGFTICEDGEVLREIESAHDSVLIPYCPTGSNLGIVHTHPPGTLQYPSDLDITSAIDHNLKFTCVVDPETKKTTCVLINNSHPLYEKYKTELLTTYDRAFGSFMRGKLDEAEEYGYRYLYTLMKATNDGVIKIVECEL